MIIKKEVTHMKCPKCQKEMKAGFLQTGGKSVIYWADKVRPLNLSYLSKESFVVSEEKSFGSNAVPSNICKACRLILSDYSEKE